MSFNRENILWQSADGTWSHGFYECHGGTEWDVEYNHDVLEYASCGHPSEDAALQSWRGANPGGCHVLSYHSDSAAKVAKHDDMAAELEDAQREQESPGRQSIFSYPQDRPFHDVRGASKSDDPVSLRRRLDTADKKYAEAVAEQHSLRMLGYSNDMTRELAGLAAKRTGLVKRLVHGGHLDTAARREHRITDLSNQVAALNRALDRSERSNARGAGSSANRAACAAARNDAAAELDRVNQPPTRPRSRKGSPTATPSASARGRVAGGVPSGGQFAAKRHGDPEIILNHP